MRAFRLSLCCLVLLGLTACGARHDRPGIDPSFVRGTDGSTADRVAAAAVSKLQSFWRAKFPSTFGEPWRDVRQFRSVDTATTGVAAPVPCTEQPTELEGNAVYCPEADTLAWDRGALIPVLRDQFGDTAVLAVLAHEMGHAVQRRTGVEPGSEEYPTALTEAMADCYAGASVHEIAGQGGAELDKVKRAISIFQDPVGASTDSSTAHGDAAERGAAFDEGYRQGIARCSAMTA